MRKVLEVESDSDSSKEAPKLKVLPTQPISKANIPISVRKQQFKAQHNQKQEQPENKSEAPVSLQRIQPQRSQQSSLPWQQAPEVTEWKEVPVKILEKCRKDHSKSFLLVDQKILFQTTELDQEKFIPKVSDWKSAEVESVAEATEDIVLVTQPRREKLKLCEYNIIGLKVRLDGLNDFQKRMVRELTIFSE